MATSSKTIVCFGDSNTHGYNSSNHGRFDETERWTCLLDNMLGSDYLIKEEGLSGRTTAFTDPFFEGLNGSTYLYPCLMTHEPVDLLIIMLGTNDTKERFSATPRNIAQGLAYLLRKSIASVDAWRDVPRILIIAPPAILPDYIHTEVAGEMGAACDKKSQALAEEYKKVADEYGCYFLDAGSIPGMEMAPYDCMHLSLKGHFLLAEKLSKVIPEIFNNRNN